MLFRSEERAYKDLDLRLTAVQETRVKLEQARTASEGLRSAVQEAEERVTGALLELEQTVSRDAAGRS